jgi:hypothetical protein
MMPMTWVLAEVADAFSRAPARRLVKPFVRDPRADRTVTIVPVSSTQFDAGLDLFSRRPDNNYLVLKGTLLAGAREREVRPGRVSPHGQKYVMDVPVPGPRGTRNVLAVWLIETGLDRPRPITCYVE